jgi:hypothetical protein
VHEADRPFRLFITQVDQQARPLVDRVTVLTTFCSIFIAMPSDRPNIDIYRGFCLQRALRDAVEPPALVSDGEFRTFTYIKWSCAA